MALFKDLKGKEYKWIWFLSTLTGGALPLIITMIVYFDGKSDDMIKVVDLVFWGLAMNLSNLNLVGSYQFEEKDLIVAFSSTLIVILAFCLGRISYIPDVNWFITTLSAIICAASIYLSYEANNFVIEVVKPKNK